MGDPLQVRIESDDLDLLRLGILNSSLHQLFNHVALAIYEEANREARANGGAIVLDHFPQNLNREDVLVRARINSVQQGSVIFDLQPLIAAVFSQPGAIAIAENLAASVIWAIGEYGTRTLGARMTVQGWPGRRDRAILRVPTVTARKKIRPRVERLVEMLRDSGNGGRITLRTQDEELQIEFYAPRDR